MTTTAKLEHPTEYTAAEVARMSGYTPRYILNLIKSGEIKARIGRDRWNRTCWKITEHEAKKAVQRKRDTIGCRYFKKSQVARASP